MQMCDLKTDLFEAEIKKASFTAKNRKNTYGDQPQTTLKPPRQHAFIGAFLLKVPSTNQTKKRKCYSKICISSITYLNINIYTISTY